MPCMNDQNGVVVKNGKMNKPYSKKSKQLINNRMSLVFKWFAQWTPEERFAFLKKLFLLSSDEERVNLHKFIKTALPETAVDFTRVLPRNLSVHIFSFLDPRSLCRACQVSHYWKILCESNAIWASKCIALGWYLSSSISYPQPGAYKWLYVEKIMSLRIADVPFAELKKIRRKIALEQQRAEEEMRNQPCMKQVRWSASDAQQVLNSSKISTIISNTLDRKPSTDIEHACSLSQPCLSGSINKNLQRASSAKARIAEAAKRLSAPLERRKNSLSHSPTENAAKEVSRSKYKVRLPASMIVAPLGQKFTPVSPESVKALPPPPTYVPETEGFGTLERTWTKTQQELFVLIKEVPT